jgi:cytochrome d ubiquinol oxidase subunit I
MTAETLARWQFGITTVYHFLFVPLTIAMSMLVAVLQTIWVRTGHEKYLKLTKFFGKLFLINFAMGVVTGIVQEFQFGMNWSEYSRFVGDIFGAPLALEALLAFFLESVFIGLWIFGWDRLPKKVHLATIWLAAIGTMLSSIFILAANSWMQNPVGSTFNPVTDRAEMLSLGAVLTNPVTLVTVPHVLLSAYMASGGFIMAVSGWHLAKLNSAAKAGKLSTKQTADLDAHRFATKFGAWVLLGASVGVIITGDIQGKIMTEVQPMKMAAAEALWETEDGCAGFSVFTIGSLDGTREVWSAPKVPCLLSFLATGSFDGKVEGMNQLAAEFADGRLVNPDSQLQQEAQARLQQLGVADWVHDGPRLPRDGGGRLRPLHAAQGFAAARHEGLDRAHGSDPADAAVRDLVRLDLHRDGPSALPRHRGADHRGRRLAGCLGLRGGHLHGALHADLRCAGGGRGRPASEVHQARPARGGRTQGDHR